MNRSVTLSAKGVLVALVATLALVVAYLLGNGGGTAQAAPQPAVAAGHVGTLVMTGTGRTVGVPDELSFSLSVGVVRPDLKSALAAANATTSRVLASLDRLGVRRTDVQTTGLQMNAVYDYHSYGPPTLRGYHVGQRAEVLARDLPARRASGLGRGRRGRQRRAGRQHRSEDRRPREPAGEVPCGRRRRGHPRRRSSTPPPRVRPSAR